MDYVVFGTGYGATLMLLGWILRTFGPDFRYRQEQDAEPPGGDFLLARMSWRRFSAGLGGLIATAGMAFVLVTFILIVVNPSNATGAWVLVGGLAVVLIAAAAWSWLYVGRYGTFGIVPERVAGEDVFRTPAEAAPEPAMTNHPVQGPVPEVAGSDSLPPGMADEDNLFAGPDDADDDAMSERQIRMSRYQSHGPGPVSADGPDDVPDDEIAPDSDHDDIVVAEEDHPVEEGLPDEDDAVDEQAEGGMVPGDESSDADDASDDEASVVEPGLEPEVDDVSPDVEQADEDGLVAGDREQAVDEAREPELEDALKDTPEGRAEALRRIQSWNPDDPD